MRRPRLLGPTVLALIVTLANAAKPVVVDDAAYLLFARHIAAEPLNPYGFELFWYTYPESAMTILAPPVLPYWLAAGIDLFGENLFLLKLWLFPFVWLLAWSLHWLLRRWARGAEDAFLILLMVSPAILSAINFMLDVPALALGLTSLVLFLKAVDNNRFLYELAAGVVLALAVQTKYTMLLMPVLILWGGLVYRKPWAAGRIVLLGILLFSAWEWFLHQRYGVSHFLYHFDDQSTVGPPSNQALPWWMKWLDAVEMKGELVAPFFGHLGGLAVALGLYAGRPVGYRKWVVTAGAGFFVLGLLAILFLPHHLTVFLRSSNETREKLTLSAVLWRTIGFGYCTTVISGLLILGWKRSSAANPRRVRRRRSRDAWFLVGWLALEAAGYFVLTPFPAGRRLIGVTVVSGLFLARVVSRVRRIKPECGPPSWVVPLAVVYGFFFLSLDGYDAGAEKAAAMRAAAVIHSHPKSGTIWFVGHWGFQYYCECEGMRPYIPGRTIIRPGDWLVLPDYSNTANFRRPFPGWLRYDSPREDQGELIDAIRLEDPVSGQTVPNFYGGIDPIVGRDGPRMTVGVYRMKGNWRPSRAFP